jgi:hypothetical protein
MSREREERRARPSSLREVDKMWSERELDEEFRILPGEMDQRYENVELDVEMQVEEGFMWEGRCVEDMRDGNCVWGRSIEMHDVERVMDGVEKIREEW